MSLQSEYGVEKWELNTTHMVFMSLEEVREKATRTSRMGV